MTIDVVFFDFGGVIAEEGFVGGLRAMAEARGLDPEAVTAKGVELAYGSGYVVGGLDEASWWRSFRRATGVDGADEQLRAEVLTRFVIRPWMLDWADALKAAGKRPAILSDQVEWLDELERRHGFFAHYDKVLNSFHTGVSKRQEAAFVQACQALDTAPERALFVDDATRNVELARRVGLAAIHYTDREGFEAELLRQVPELGHA